MFIYENGNSLNLTFKGTMPVENPDVIIKGYVNGAALIVNGSEVVSVTDAEEFSGKAPLFAYQKGGKLAITFRGIDGMSNPEVTLDEVTPGVVDVVVNGEEVVLTYTDSEVSVGEKSDEIVEETENEPETPVEDGPTYELPEVTEEEEQ